MKNIERAFRNHTHIEKIRIARFISQTITSGNPDSTPHDGTMNTVLGLLNKGDMNCAGEELTNDLFGNGDTKQPTTTGDLHATPRTRNEIAGSGVVMTEAEKKKAEEEARRKKEMEEEQKRIEEERRRQEAEEKRRNSFWHKAMRGLKKFGEQMIKEEE